MQKSWETWKIGNLENWKPGNEAGAMYASPPVSLVHFHTVTMTGDKTMLPKVSYFNRIHHEGCGHMNDIHGVTLGSIYVCQLATHTAL